MLVFHAFALPIAPMYFKPPMPSVKPALTDTFTQTTLQQQVHQRSGTTVEKPALTPLNPRQITAYFQTVQEQINTVETNILEANPKFLGKTSESLQQAFIADYLFLFPPAKNYEEGYSREREAEKALQSVLINGLKRGHYSVVAEELEWLKSEEMQSNNTGELPNALVKIRRVLTN